MLGKFALIALVCVSVAQVRGDELDDAIDRGVRRISQMYQNGKDRYDEVLREGDASSKDIARRSDLIVQRERKVQESSRQALRNVAETVEEKARESNRPESVFRCIKTAEDRANSEIETFANRFQTDIERLLNTKQDNIEVALRACEGLENELTGNFQRAIENVVQCQNSMCVNNIVGSFSRYVSSYYLTLKRVERQVGTVVTNFQRDASNYYTNSNRQITRVRSTGLRSIRLCYYNGRRGVFDFKDFQESESTEVQEF